MSVGPGLAVAAERPLYTAAQAARYAKTSPVTTRRWVEGYEYDTVLGRRAAPPVGQHRTGERYLTFYDLVEVAAIAAAKNAGVTLPRIRAAVDYAKRLFEVDRPLLLERFLTDGRDLYLRELRPGAIPLHLNASEAGQTAFPYIADVLRHLDYEAERPARWWPAGKSEPIMIDPRVSFGQPIIVPGGIRTETLADRFYAGEDLDEIAAEYGLDPRAIQEALRFENTIGLIPA